jgi:signal transduction histidine kinase
MNVEQDRVSLRISDQGHGFDTATVLAREYSREHFGLRGIQDRVRAMGGEFEVMSAPGAGTSILIDLPRNGNRSHI